MKEIMSQGLVNRLRENKAIYNICLEELKDGDNKYPGDFSYPESLEFNDRFVILRLSNMQRLRTVIKNINKHLKSYGNIIKPFTRKEMEETNKRMHDRNDKLLEHLTELRGLRTTQSENKASEAKG